MYFFIYIGCRKSICGLNFFDKLKYTDRWNSKFIQLIRKCLFYMDILRKYKYSYSIYFQTYFQSTKKLLKSRCLKVGNFTVWAKMKFTIFIRAIIVAYQIKPLDVTFPMIAAFFSKSINLTRYQALNVCKELLILRKMLI